MARSLSWLNRLVPIARTVQDSARSHYDRKEIQRLFELQPRSAQQLMAALPNISVGRARLVEREALSKFLCELNDTDKPAEAFARMKSRGGKAVLRKLREFSLEDHRATVDSPPPMMNLERGDLRVKFQTLEELAQAMLWLANVLRDDLEGFAAKYESTVEDPAREDETIYRAEAAYFRDWTP